MGPKNTEDGDEKAENDDDAREGQAKGVRGPKSADADGGDDAGENDGEDEDGVLVNGEAKRTMMSMMMLRC